MKYIYCTLAIGEQYVKNVNVLFSQLLKQDNCDMLVVTNYPELIIKNPRIYVVAHDGKSCFTTNSEIFNYNLKYLPIKYASKTLNDYIIYLDGDWRLYEEYSPNKINKITLYMKNNNIDFFFERPHIIKGAKSDYPNSFINHKLEFYNLLNIEKYDEAQVPNEQFLIFYNSPKIKTFYRSWEEKYKATHLFNLWTYGEGVEIGMSAIDANLTHLEDYNSIRLLSNCFIFTDISGQDHVRF